MILDQPPIEGPTAATRAMVEQQAIDARPVAGMPGIDRAPDFTGTGQQAPQRADIRRILPPMELDRVQRQARGRLGNLGDGGVAEYADRRPPAGDQALGPLDRQRARGAGNQDQADVAGGSGGLHIRGAIEAAQLDPAEH
jgi:hypothetical protein